MQANLRYWAYWVGGVRPCWSADADMLALHPYTGEVLVDSLIASLADAPYRELCAHSMWALLRLRPRLAGDPARGGRMSGIIGAGGRTAGEHARPAATPAPPPGGRRPCRRAAHRTGTPHHRADRRARGSQERQASLEARCSRDADKLECLVQAREYQHEGYTQLEPWITTMADAVTTTTTT